MRKTSGLSEMSVILPVYNGEKFIKESIDSILSQTYKNFILHVIDDGSTDTTFEILKQFKDNRLKIIKNEKNLGLISTLNLGLKISEDFKYIVRMDADDISNINRFRIQYDFLESNQEVGVLGTASNHFGGNTFDRNKYNPMNHNDIITSFICNNPISHPTVMIRNRLLDGFCYDPNFPKYEDYVLWINLINKCKFHNLNSVLLNYRRHQNNITNTYKSNPDFDFDIFKNILKLYESKFDYHFSNEELMIITTITSKSRYGIHPELDVKFIFETISTLVKRVPEKLNKKYLFDLLILKSIMYLYELKRIKDIMFLIRLSNSYFRIRKFFFLQYNGKY